MDRKRIEGLPVWMLTPKEEKEVFENWRINTWKKCDEQVKAFTECEKLAGYGVWFKCRKQSGAMRDCIRQHQDTKFVDEERDKFIAKKIEFQKEQERLEKEQIDKEENAKKAKSNWGFWGGDKKDRS